MGFVVFNAGDASPLFSLGKFLREKHEETAKAVREEIERREKLGVPLDDLKPLGDFEHGVQLDEVMISVKMVTFGERSKAAFAMREALGDEENLTSKSNLEYQAKCNEFLKKALADVQGLVDGDGVEIPFDADKHLSMLWDNGLGTPIYQACFKYQMLTGVEKKQLSS